MEEENGQQAKKAKKCQWCNNEFIGKTTLFCYECLQKMKEMVLEGRDKINHPTSNQSCVVCGEFENRIMYLYNEKDSKKAGVPVCDLCVEKEMAIVEKLWRIR